MTKYTKFYIIEHEDIKMRKPIEFLGGSLEGLKMFPLDAKREAGHQLDRVQLGLEPDDWKPMNAIGTGIREIRIRDANGIYRVMYVTKFADTVYVLHCFQKKTEKSSKPDLALVTKRYKEIARGI